MSVIFPDGTTVLIPEGHTILQSSVPLQMAAGDSLTLSSDVMFTVEELTTYLGVDNAWGALEDLIQIHKETDFPDTPWYHVKLGNLPMTRDTYSTNATREEYAKYIRNHITMALTSFRVALQMCDDATQDKCKIYLHWACRRVSCGLITNGMVRQIVDMFSNNKLIIEELLGSLPVEYIIEMVSYQYRHNGGGPLFDSNLYEGLDTSPYFEGDILLGLDPEALLVSSIKNYIIMNEHRLDNAYLLERLAVKYIDGDSDLPNNPEDIKMFIRLKELLSFESSELLEWLMWDDEKFRYCNSMRNMLTFRMILSDNMSSHWPDCEKYYQTSPAIAESLYQYPGISPKYHTLAMLSWYVIIKSTFNLPYYNIRVLLKEFPLSMTNWQTLSKIKELLAERGIILQ